MKRWGPQPLYLPYDLSKSGWGRGSSLESRDLIEVYAYAEGPFVGLYHSCGTAYLVFLFLADRGNLCTWLWWKRLALDCVWLVPMADVLAPFCILRYHSDIEAIREEGQIPIWRDWHRKASHTPKRRTQQEEIASERARAWLWCNQRKPNCLPLEQNRLNRLVPL